MSKYAAFELLFLIECVKISPPGSELNKAATEAIVKECKRMNNPDTVEEQPKPHKYASGEVA